MPGYRLDCSFCSSSILMKDFGKHIIKNHSDQFFTKTNLKDLHKEKYLVQPMPLLVEEQIMYCCFADNSFIKKESLADSHFKGKAQKHREAIMTLRQKYPLAGGVPQEQPIQEQPQTSGGVLTAAERDTLQMWIAQVIRQDLLGFTRKDKAVFSKLGILIEREQLQVLFPKMFPDEEEEQEDNEEEEF